MEKQTVSVPIERYEELLSMETRSGIVVDCLCSGNFCETESLLRILGTEKAIKKADEIKEAEERRHAEYLAQRERGKKNADV